MMPTPEVSEPRRRWPVDRVVTAVLSVVAALAAFGSVWLSFIFVMANDSCFPNECETSTVIMWAHLVTWGGVALAVVIAVVGLIVAIRRGTVMWVWPALALVVVTAALAGGAELAGSVTD